MKIILIRELAAMLRVAPITIRRWLHRARKGENSFPLPISHGDGGTLRWLAADIEAFLQSQSNTIPPVTVSTTKQRREAKMSEHRQEAARQALERHRKPK